jgi:hypothetical protein
VVGEFSAVSALDFGDAIIFPPFHSSHYLFLWEVGSFRFTNVTGRDEFGVAPRLTGICAVFFVCLASAPGRRPFSESSGTTVGKASTDHDHAKT